MKIELTWKIIKDIADFTDYTLEHTDKKELLTFGQEGFYTKVLEQVEAYYRKGTDI